MAIRRRMGLWLSPINALPLGTQIDNLSSKAIVNPYTGKEGAKEPQK
jgi:hypothetical protein